MKKYDSVSRYVSPWSIKEKIGMFLWDVCWCVFCAWTPKPMNGWRLMWLKVFGAKIKGNPFVHQRVRINIPWNITLHDKAVIGDRTNLYALGEIEVRERATVAQEAYICTGTHDMSDFSLPLVTAEITIGEEAFICARAFVMPGVKVGKGAVVGACSVVTKDVPDWKVAIGNPARVIKDREVK